MSPATKPNRETRTPHDLDRIRRLHEELIVLDNEVAHHRREIKHIKEARKEVEAELQRLISGQANDHARDVTRAVDASVLNVVRRVAHSQNGASSRGGKRPAQERL